MERHKPELVIGSVPFTLFERLQELNTYMYNDSRQWMLKFQEKMAEAKRYLKFCADIYQYQRENG